MPAKTIQKQCCFQPISMNDNEVKNNIRMSNISVNVNPALMIEFHWNSRQKFYNKNSFRELVKS